MCKSKHAISGHGATVNLLPPCVQWHNAQMGNHATCMVGISKYKEIGSSADLAPDLLQIAHVGTNPMHEHCTHTLHPPPPYPTNTVSNEHFRSDRINLGPNELGTKLGTGLQPTLFVVPTIPKQGAVN